MPMGQRKGEAVGYDLVDSQAGLGVGDAEIPPEEVAQIDDVLLPQRWSRPYLAIMAASFRDWASSPRQGLPGIAFIRKNVIVMIKKMVNQCG